MFGTARSNELIPLYGPDEDLSTPKEAVVSRNWCRIQRDAGLGRFVNRSRAFQLFAPKLARTTVSDTKKLPGQGPAPSLVVGKKIMDSFVDAGQSFGEQAKHRAAVEIVHGWNPRVARRRHRESLRRYQQSKTLGNPGEGQAVSG